MAFSQPMVFIIAVCCCAILTACAPLPSASAPPQLRHTPGAFVEIVDGHFKAGSFQFDYPSSWRLVKQSAANADGMHITLLAPAGGALSFQVVATDKGQDDLFIPLAKGNFLLVTVVDFDDLPSDVTAEFERIIRSIRS